MKFLTVFILILGSFLIAALQSTSGKLAEYSVAYQKYSTGAPAGKTGAPGEGALSCTECHAGSVNDGSSQNILTVYDASLQVTTAYIPDEVYTVSLALVDEDVKEGFQATVLDNNYNNMAGTFLTSGSVGTQIVPYLGRDYATHKSASSNAGNVSWDWEWQAPAVESGPVTFYVASNIANGNGTASGDDIYLSQHVIYSILDVNTEQQEDLGFKAGYNSEVNALHIQFNSLSVENMFVKVVNLSGKSEHSSTIGNSKIGLNKQKVQLPETIKSGMYVVQFFLGNKAMSSKIYID